MPLDIVYYPDPILNRKADPVTAFDQRLSEVVDAMFAAMYENAGVGLAAPQVGVSKRFFVANPNPKTKDLEQVFINPEFLELSGEQLGEEGCLSIPEVRGKVLRAQRVVVRAQNLKGESFTVEAEDFLARIMQHEFDHIEGRLFIDKLSITDKALIEGRLKQLRAEYEEEHPPKKKEPPRHKSPKKGKRH